MGQVKHFRLSNVEIFPLQSLHPAIYLLLLSLSAICYHEIAFLIIIPCEPRVYLLLVGCALGSAVVRRVVYAAVFQTSACPVPVHDGLYPFVCRDLAQLAADGPVCRFIPFRPRVAMFRQNRCHAIFPLCHPGRPWDQRRPSAFPGLPFLCRIVRGI